MTTKKNEQKVMQQQGGAAAQGTASPQRTAQVRRNKRATPLYPNKVNHYQPARQGLSTLRGHKTEHQYEQEQQYQNNPFGSTPHRCKRNRIRTGQRTGRHQRSHLHGHLVFRPRHETHLRHRRSGRTHRRREGLWQVLVGRPRHLQDRRKLVRSMYLPHRGSHHSALVLPII